ncbi:hypothetical protein DLJ53_29475 [Acuticoccus sediminis]|uniref:ABC transporter domain-containing protein n=2 Tax=Acuticoccus sediminis TaxID=2184697 RepID=A0A8B2NJQ0_9HYPH|nr:hypothetical protein DLJ53_29475 [Acuticoccus sediminis]
MTVPDGEVVAVMGASGSGKSTLLRCATLLEPPDAGRVCVGGDELTGAGPRRLAALRTRIGMVFQHFNLFPHLSAQENVMLGLVHTLGMSGPEAAERAATALARVKLGDRLAAYPRHLSGGQQQRVAIARAIAMQPRLILFDEPTSALDAETVNEVIDVMKALVADGMTMVVVSHEIGFVKSAADRVVFLADGTIVEDCATAAFFADPAQPDVRRFLTAIL